MSEENKAAEGMLQEGKGTEAVETPNVSEEILSVQTVEEIIASISTEEIPHEMEIVRNARGANDFIPKTDKQRLVKEYKPLSGRYGSIHIGVTSISKGEGGTINHRELESAFGIKLKGIENKMQATIYLGNGRVLIGYVVNTRTTQRVYCPAKYFPAGFKLPSLGFKAKMPVACITIG